MGEVFGSVVRSGFAAGQRSLRKHARKLGVRLGLLALAAVLGLGGLGYLSHALYLLLSRTVAAWQAALSIGAALVLLAGVTILIARRAGGSHRGRNRADSAEDPGWTMGRLLARPELQTSDILLASFVAGIVFGASPRSRGADSRVRGSRSESTRSERWRASGREIENGGHASRPRR
jgi:hypothetical protein